MVEEHVDQPLDECARSAGEGAADSRLGEFHTPDRGRMRFRVVVTNARGSTSTHVSSFKLAKSTRTGTDGTPHPSNAGSQHLTRPVCC
jgi:hypothetical protein